MKTINFKINPLIGIIVFLLFFSQNIYSQSNWLKRGSDSTKYEMGIDNSTLYDGKIVMTVKSIESDFTGFGTYMQKIIPGKYIGKRIKVTGNLKSKDVSEWAGFWVRVDQADPLKILSFDNMDERPIKGTTDWGKYEIVLDVPENASIIAFGALLSGTGQIWFDDLIFEIVPNSTPTTGNKQND